MTLRQLLQTLTEIAEMLPHVLDEEVTIDTWNEELEIFDIIPSRDGLMITTEEDGEF